MLKKVLVLFFIITIFSFMWSESISVGSDDKLIIKINVWGQVQKPGQYDVEYDSSIIQAISKAGGFNDYAHLGRIKVIRMVKGKKKIIKVNIKNYLKTLETKKLPKLENGDIIYIEKNAKKDWVNFVTFVSQIAIIVNVIYILVNSTK
ncbi:SLBB domain-containing protein [bacterium]|nr:SLBB domain-containing protein [bacterium]